MIPFRIFSPPVYQHLNTPSPVGGNITKVYKNSDAIIDGENKPFLQQKFAEGLVMVHFLGHSGGRVWGVDIGSPSQLQNTTGMLPFVASVSCNVGFFSDPRSNVLSEDFLLADNRGAIAVWSAASLGYSTVGKILVDKFLSQAANDYSRNIGLMTTIARINFWVLNNRYATPLIIQSMNLHPLIGDPYTHLAMPVKPDFEVTSNDITLANNPPLADSVLTLNVKVLNNGLAANSPVTVSIRDSYTDENGHTASPTDIIPPFPISDFTGVDSFTVHWNVQGKAGSHVLTVTMDPNDSIPEISESNNQATQSFYIYRNTIQPVQPIPQTLVSTLTPLLTSTVPAGQDTSAITYKFEIDTTLAFNSPLKMSSGSVVPGAVTASWRTPSLQSGQIYYWRSQASTTLGSGLQGAWSLSSFTHTTSPLSGDTAYWQQTGKLFSGNTLTRTSVTDSGATLLRSDSTTLYARSLGFRANTNTDFYSVLQINTTIAYGLYWDDPYSFIAGWYNPVDGTYLLKGYNFLRSGDTEKMRDFLANVPVGTYVLLTAVWDARQNMTDTLTTLIKALGSTKIDSLQRGQSWVLISQKGVQMPVVEQYRASVNVEATVKVPNFFRLGTALVTTAPIGPAYRWGRATWDVSLPNGNTTDTIRVLGIRKSNGLTDTLMTVPSGSASVNLSGINAQTYPTLRLAGTLACIDGLSSPVLKKWGVTYQPPADLAISPWSIHVPATVSANTNFQVGLDIYNPGLRTARNIWISTTLMDDTTQRSGGLLDTIAAGGFRHVDLTMNITGANGLHYLIAAVETRTGDAELLSGNNSAIRAFTLTGAANASAVKVFFDKVEIRDGDFVSPRPSISFEFPPVATAKSSQSFSVLIDGHELQRNITVANGSTISSAESIPVTNQLADGTHTLEIRTAGTSQNTASTQPVKSVTFQVASTTALRDLFNYPNPFAGNTLFTFVLTGMRVPDALQIKVYTVAGRLIRTIHIDGGTLQIGLNRIPWDGRDEQGDEIANGNYFYKISTTGNGESAETVQRMVKLR